MPPIARIAALLLVGCSPKGPPTPPRPASVVVHGIEPSGLDFEGVRGDLVLELRDAGRTPVPRRVEWDLVLADAVVLSGQGAATPDDGRFTTPIDVAWADVVPALDAIGGGDTVPWTLTGTFRLQGPSGELALPLQGAGVLPALVPPDVVLQALLLRDLDLRNGLAAGDLLLTVDSPQTLELLRLEHRLTVDGVVAHEGTALPQPVDTPLSIQPEAPEAGAPMAPHPEASEAEPPDAGAPMALHPEAPEAEPPEAEGPEAEAPEADDAQVLSLPLTLDLNPLDEAVLDALATRSPLMLRFEGAATVRTPHGEIPLDIDVERLVPVRDVVVEPGLDGFDAGADPGAPELP